MNVLDSFQLAGRRALITGSSAGIGLALAEALAQAGAHVVLNGRTATKVTSAADTLKAQGWSVSTSVFDVTDADQVREAVSRNADLRDTVHEPFCCIRRERVSTLLGRGGADANI